MENRIILIAMVFFALFTNAFSEDTNKTTGTKITNETFMLNGSPVCKVKKGSGIRRWTNDIYQVLIVSPDDLQNSNLFLLNKQGLLMCQFTISLYDSVYLVENYLFFRENKKNGKWLCYNFASDTLVKYNFWIKAIFCINKSAFLFDGKYYYSPDGKKANKIQEMVLLSPLLFTN